MKRGVPSKAVVFPVEPPLITVNQSLKLVLKSFVDDAVGTLCSGVIVAVP